MSTLTRTELVERLRLFRADQVGPVTFERLIERHGSAKRAVESLPGLGVTYVPSREDAEREIAAGEAIGARLIAQGEALYPAPLAAADSAPPLLWAWGEPRLMHRPCIAMVGARIASAAGQRFARQLAEDLGEAGFVVVSGLARGIDAAAHGGALASGTVAVMAGGVDDAFPPENRDLHARLAQGGCIVSERPIGHSARAKDFPRRNRIISGLSLGVVVVEAELRSGSLITARLAGEQGREVFAVPGSPLDPRCRGSNDLIRNGATLVEEAGDVIRALEGQSGVQAPTPRRNRAPEPGFAENSEGFDLAALLSPTPTAIDDLARAAGAPVTEILAAVTELSLEGRADLLPGGLVVAR